MILFICQHVKIINPSPNGCFQVFDITKSFNFAKLWQLKVLHQECVISPNSHILCNTSLSHASKGQWLNLCPNSRLTQLVINKAFFKISSFIFFLIHYIWLPLLCVKCQPAQISYSLLYVYDYDIFV